MYDYNGDEECSRERAESAIGAALHTGYSNVVGAREAIITVGRESAIQVYIDSWTDRHSDEYSED